MKAYTKRGTTRTDAVRAGDDLLHAVQQMQARAETERAEGELFFIDDYIPSPFDLSKRLAVRINYRWRFASTDEWTHRQITFKHECSPLVDYAQASSKRKPSVAQPAHNLQDKLLSEWEHMKTLALCSLRDFFRKGGDASNIPEEFELRPGRYGGLNNFSANFWVPPEVHASDGEEH